MFKLTLLEKNNRMEIEEYEVSSDFFLKNEIFRGKVYAKLKDVQQENIQDSFTLNYARKIDFSNITVTKSKQESDNVTLTNKKASNITQDNTVIQQIFMKERFLCSIDERYTLESIKKMGKIEIPSFLLVTKKVAVDTIAFNFQYYEYPSTKHSEKVSFIFDLYREK